MNKVYICGDTHGNWPELSRELERLSTLNKDDKVYLFVCGDFGYWPAFQGFSLQDLVVPDNVFVYFTPGNHEDWDALDKISAEHPNESIHEVATHIYYCEFGAILTVDNTTFLFCGGAASTDKHWRKEGVSWFKQEIITDADMQKLPECSVDVIISHTCPSSVHYDITKYIISDDSEHQLQKVLEKYKPKFWYFGHWHELITKKKAQCVDGHISNVVFTCLADFVLSPNNNWLTQYI